MRLRETDKQAGSSLLEGTIVIFILALVFLGVVRLGSTALRQQQVQSDIDNRAWSKALGTSPQSKSASVQREFLGWRATELTTQATPKTSFRIDVADGF